MGCVWVYIQKMELRYCGNMVTREQSARGDLLGTLNPHGINKCFFIQLIYSCFLVTIFLSIA